MAAGEGFEPSHTESESAVLPLHKPAVSVRRSLQRTDIIIQKSDILSRGFFNIPGENFEKFIYSCRRRKILSKNCPFPVSPALRFSDVPEPRRRPRILGPRRPGTTPRPLSSLLPRPCRFRSTRPGCAGPGGSVALLRFCTNGQPRSETHV